MRGGNAGNVGGVGGNPNNYKGVLKIGFGIKDYLYVFNVTVDKNNFSLNCYEWLLIAL